MSHRADLPRIRLQGNACARCGKPIEKIAGAKRWSHVPPPQPVKEP